jgi:HPr kinase/phosphorylase
VTVGAFYERGRERLGLRLAAGGGGDGLARVIEEPVLYRCGLALSGFYDFFAFRRIQLIGSAEHAYLKAMPEPRRIAALQRLFQAGIPCVILSGGLPAFAETVELADTLNVPVFLTAMTTLRFTSQATLLLEHLSAPRRKVHGTMIEVAGLGILIEGPAGIGKSETALGLIKRGHALVADDLTELRRDADGVIHGAAVPVTRHYMEIRGIGIIYVPALFGVAAVRGEKSLDLVITLLPQQEGEHDLDRSGDQTRTRELLGVRIPQLIIPVAPGRDLVNIAETAAMEYKLKLSGQVAHRDLDEQIKRHHTGSGE